MSYGLAYNAYAVYRLTVPPPVTVCWKSGAQTLLVKANPHPPYGSICIRDEGEISEWAGLNCHSFEHAMHIIQNGWKVSVPSMMQTFMDRLVREGRAERIAGPHCEFSPQCYCPPARVIFRGKDLDAFYTFKAGVAFGKSAS